MSERREAYTILNKKGGVDAEAYEQQAALLRERLNLTGKAAAAIAAALLPLTPNERIMVLAGLLRQASTQAVDAERIARLIEKTTGDR